EYASQELKTLMEHLKILKENNKNLIELLEQRDIEIATLKEIHLSTFGNQNLIDTFLNYSNHLMIQEKQLNQLQQQKIELKKEIKKLKNILKEVHLQTIRLCSNMNISFDDNDKNLDYCVKLLKNINNENKSQITTLIEQLSLIVKILQLVI